MELVSAVMPTANRRHFIPQAIDSFLSQTYENKELWILDDGVDPSGDLVPDNERIHYVGMSPKMTIPVKRNQVNSLTQGEIIVHWDDDDWSDAGRMVEQVEQLKGSKKQMVGYHSLAFWDERTRQAYWYQGTEHVYACGTSQCYWRGFWELNHFDETIPLSSDNWFSRAARIRNELWTSSAEQMMVARIHAGTSNSKDGGLGSTQFPKMDQAKLNKRFPECRLAA